jgi:hypothetical protein
MSDLYPIVTIQDRYAGTYSGGTWIACANGDELHEGVNRIAWLLEHGPGGNDLEATQFWNNPPGCVAVGPSSDGAIANLRRKIESSTADSKSQLPQDSPN